MLLILLIQVALYAHASVFATGSPKDQYRNQAAINGFLREQPLGWQEPYYESGNPIADRMILTYWVLAQALLVELSGAPILLARYLITPFVMLMSVAALYIFARNLGHGRRAALVFVCLGLLAFSLLADVDTQAGTRFFVRAQLDKVAAAFAPGAHRHLQRLALRSRPDRARGPGICSELAGHLLRPCHHRRFRRRGDHALVPHPFCMRRP